MELISLITLVILIVAGGICIGGGVHFIPVGGAPAAMATATGVGTGTAMLAAGAGLTGLITAASMTGQAWYLVALAGAVGAMLLGFASLPVAAGIAVASVGHMLMSGYKASIEADIQKGDFNNSNANFAHNYMNFYMGRQSCNKVYARRIDDYFTRFGYALGINAIPQINVRPHWTYVKTIGCTVKGSIPSDDMKKICSIYDKGITFWRNANEVGNYSLDNSPQP